MWQFIVSPTSISNMLAIFLEIETSSLAISRGLWLSSVILIKFVSFKTKSDAIWDLFDNISTDDSIIGLPLTL